MKKYKASKMNGGLYSLLFFLFLFAGESYSSGKYSHKAPGSFIVKVNRHKKEALLKSIRNISSSEYLGSLNEKYYYKIKAKARENHAELGKIVNREGSDYYENHYMYSMLDDTVNDPHFQSQWYLEKINVKEAWALFEGNGTVPVYVLDTGLDFDHEDLVGKTAVNEGETPDNGEDDDGNGYIDDYRGYDFVSVDPSQTVSGDGFPMDADASDTHTHGTVVTGLICPITDNYLGGAAINRNGKTVPLRVAFSDGTGSLVEEGDVVSAVLYAVNNGAKVINFSYGGTYKMDLLGEVIKEAEAQGVLFLAAAGNDNNVERRYYPAAYPEAIAIGGMNSYNDNYYCYGSWIDAVLPATRILSTENGGGYAYNNGTSVATPMASAIVAYCMEFREDLDYAQARSLFFQLCGPINEFDFNRNRLGYGAPDLGKLKNMADKPIFSYEIPRYESDFSDALFTAGENMNFHMNVTNPDTLSYQGNIQFITINDDVLYQKEVAIREGTNPLSISFPLPPGNDNNREIIAKVVVSGDKGETVSLFKKSCPYYINPVLYTIESSDLRFSVSSRGLLGHNDASSGDFNHSYNENQMGDGLQYKNHVDQLYHGSVWFGGENYQVVDGTTKNEDGRRVSEWEMETPLRHGSEKNDPFQNLHAVYTDTNKKIIVSQNVSWNESGYVVVKLDITVTDTVVVQPRAGLFFDFDMIIYNKNGVNYDPDRKTVFQYCKNENLRIGVKSLSEGPCYVNDLSDFYSNNALTLSDSKKYEMLNGVSVGSQLGDMSFTCATGREELSAEDTLTAIFAIAAADDSAALVSILDRAKTEYLTDINERNAPSRRKVAYDVYPKPAKQYVVFEKQGETNHSKSTIEIYNILGRRILKRNYMGSPVKIDLSGFSSGIYFYSIKNDDVVIARDKFVVIK